MTTRQIVRVLLLADTSNFDYARLRQLGVEVEIVKVRSERPLASLSAADYQAVVLVAGYRSADEADQLPTELQKRTLVVGGSPSDYPCYQDFGDWAAATDWLLDMINTPAN